MVGFIFVIGFFLLQDVPFKPAEEFDIRLDYQFRQRPAPELNTVQLGRKYEPRATSTVLPYLVLDIRILKLSGEKMRVRITNNLGDKVVQKKIAENTVLELDLGFTDDMKDRVTAHTYSLVFLDEQRRPVDRILIEVGEDGSFYVNGEKHGGL